MSEPLVTITVRGKPEPRGSKQPFVVYANRATKTPARRKDGSIIVATTDDNPKSKAWMEHVRVAAIAAWRVGERWGPLPREAAVDVAVTFFVRRPEGHYGSGRNARFVKDSAPAHPTTIPDLDKLLRGTLDALTGIVWTDDSQIVRILEPQKRYAIPTEDGDGQGVMLVVSLAAEQTAADLPLELRTRYHVEPHEDDAQASLLDAA